MTPERLAELKALADGCDHLELFLNPLDHIFIGSVRNPERDNDERDGLFPPKRRDININVKTAHLLLQARTAIPELIAEVERLKLEAAEWKANFERQREAAAAIARLKGAM